MKKAFLVVAAAVIVPVALAILLPYWLAAIILFIVVAATIGYFWLTTLENDMLPEQEHEDYNDDIGTGY